MGIKYCMKMIKSCFGMKFSHAPNVPNVTFAGTGCDRANQTLSRQTRTRSETTPPREREGEVEKVHTTLISRQ